MSDVGMHVLEPILSVAGTWINVNNATLAAGAQQRLTIYLLA